MALAPKSLFDQLLYSTTRVTAMRDAIEIQYGTAFYYSVRLPNDRELLLLITNRHVIDEANKLSIVVHTAGDDGVTPSGHTVAYEIEINPSYNVVPDDPTVDLVGIPISTIVIDLQNRGLVPVISKLSRDNIPLEPEWDMFDSLEEIIMVGCPNGIFDSHNRLPMFRKGITASPLAFRYENKDQFLVDAACYKGSSGSPIFAYGQLGRYDRTSNTFQLGQSSMKFIGVLFAGPTFKQIGNVTMSIKPIAHIETFLHLGLALRATALFELESKAIALVTEVVG